jgi:hypothetical protein
MMTEIEHDKIIVLRNLVQTVRERMIPCLAANRKETLGKLERLQTEGVLKLLLGRLPTADEVEIVLPK